MHINHEKMLYCFVEIINGQNTSMSFTRAWEWYSWHFKSTWHDIKILIRKRERECECVSKRKRKREKEKERGKDFLRNLHINRIFL